MSIPRRILLLLIGAAVLTALLVGLRLPATKAFADPNGTSANYNLFWDVVASGGPPLTSTHYIMYSTAGQPGIGTSNSAHYALHSGYWFNNPYIYLPMLIK